MTAHSQSDALESVLADFRRMAMFEGYELVVPESPGMDGDTPLHVAAMDGRLDLLEKMLPFVREIDTPGDMGNTPLHCAVLWGRSEIVRLFLRHGANVMRANDYGDTPLSLMKERPGFEDVMKDSE